MTPKTKSQKEGKPLHNAGAFCSLQGGIIMDPIFHPPFIANCIKDELEGTAWIFAGNDRNVLKQMCDEINQTFPDFSYKIEYLSEIAITYIPAGVSAILLKYIYQFESESCRSVLLVRIVIENKEKKVKIKDLDRIVMDLYHNFRVSPYYISPPESGSSAHMYIRYDNSLRYVVSPKILPELVEIMNSRRDFYLLSQTAFKIARKWAPKELGEIIAAHLTNKNVTRADVGLPEEGKYYPSLETIVEQSSFTAIKCLQFYPSEDNLRIIMDYTNHSNKDLAKFAQEHAEKMKKKLVEM